jgi:16S rRNA (guanine1207-N2)-methyltransferase
MIDRTLISRDRANQMLDAYGALLTARQREFLRRYYADDLSLGEIAAQMRVSRQAVHDGLQRALGALERYESALRLVAHASGGGPPPIEGAGAGVVREHYFTRVPTSRMRQWTIRETLRGRSWSFRVASGVFSGRSVDAGTRLLIETMRIGPGDRVLDLGCGYGVVGLTAAALARKGQVWLIDSNERAAGLAAKNAADHELSNTHVIVGDGAAAIRSASLDVVVTNPPIRAGRRAVTAFIDEAWRVLRPGGRFYLVARTAQGARTIAKLIAERFGTVAQVRATSGYRVYEARRAPERLRT